tara:strand:+ start:29 stop:475 length:447 start_codon:yes stop_codon:yes gene_type:complete
MKTRLILSDLRLSAGGRLTGMSRLRKILPRPMKRMRAQTRTRSIRILKIAATPAMATADRAPQGIRTRDPGTAATATRVAAILAVGQDPEIRATETETETGTRATETATPETGMVILAMVAKTPAVRIQAEQAAPAAMRTTDLSCRTS